jgi:anhydro-N-acetylmuramic acid kinase
MAFNKDKEELKELDKEYGRYLGTITKRFIEKYDMEPKLIASHGHTIFHRPEEGFTLQIGDGQEIANITGIMTINDFRTEDVEKGGQGAPLVPIGDRHLFAEYPICLNIGGIANVSYETNNQRTAYDICMANQLLNYLAGKLGYDYDNNGNIAKRGKVNKELLDILNDNPYYRQEAPKSLGREFFENVQHKIVDESDLSVADLLATATEHIAIQIADATRHLDATKILVTGGGAKNRFLIDRISALSKHEIIIPDTLIVDYKEALIFAFLASLKMEGKINVLSSVTGASSDSSSGKIWMPNNL